MRLGSFLRSGLGVCVGTSYPDILRPGKEIDVNNIAGPFHLE